MAKIAMSYRRADSAAIAGRMRDRLAAQYGDDSVFMDIYKVPMGSDFPEHVRRVWSQTQILLVLIGANWLRRADPLSPRVALRYVAVPAFALLVAHYLIVNAFDLHVICASPVLSSPCRSGLRSSGKHERDRLPPLPSARSLAWLRPAR